MTETEFSRLKSEICQRVPQIEPFLFCLPSVLVDDETWKAKFNPNPTACVTADGFFFSISFLDSLPKPKQLGLILHETIHLMNQDLGQPWIDRSIPLESFRLLSNIAQDHRNEGLIDEIAIADRPEGKREDRPICANYAPEKFEKYKGWGWRAIYDDILQQCRNNPSSDGSGIDLGGMEGVDAPPSGNPVPQQLLDLAKKESERILEDMKNRGTLRGGALVGIKAEEPVIPWLEVLKDCLTQVKAPIRKTYTKVKRRPFANRGVYLPTLTGHTEALDKVAICIDTSGSMHSTLGKVAGDVIKLLKDLHVNHLDIIFYDIGILEQRVVKYEDMPDFKLDTMPAGGGTSIQGALAELVTQDTWEGQPLIVLTDGCDDYNVSGHVAKELGTVVFVSYSKLVESSLGRCIQVN